MPAIVRVLPLWTKNPPGLVISTVSNAKSSFSPFLLGPCKLYDGYVSRNMENGWQYSKVYAEHIDEYGSPSLDYWKWAKAGWDNRRASRYPMGKGRKPEYSFWCGDSLSYIQARKTIYVPLYVEAVLQEEKAFAKLKRLYRKEKEISLLDYDAYDHRALGRTLSDVLNSPDKKCGHAFVLAMLLTNDKALKQCDIREDL